MGSNANPAPGSTPSTLPAELTLAVQSTSTIAQTILAADGQKTAAELLPVITSLAVTAIGALATVDGPVTVEKLKALLGQNVPLDPL